MALPAPYLSYLQALNFDPEDLEYLDNIYTQSGNNTSELNEYLSRQYGITPKDITNHQMGERQAPAQQQRTTFRASGNQEAMKAFPDAEDVIDNIVASGGDYSPIVNYGKPDNNDERARNLVSMVRKNKANDNALAANPKMDLNNLQPMTAGESIEGLRQAGTSMYRDVKETAAPVIQRADEATKGIRQAVSATAAPVIQKAKQYGQPIYEEYIERPVQREYQRQKDIYNTLAADPEATLEGAKAMANDAGEYIRDTAHTIRNESPGWVARFSKALSEGSNFGRELKDAWQDPDYYLAGGRYENKGYKSKQLAEPSQNYQDRIQQKLDSMPTAKSYVQPDASKLPSAGSISVGTKQAPAVAQPQATQQIKQAPQQPTAVKQSGFSIHRNNTVQY